jgi:hypothetical protein
MTTTVASSELPPRAQSADAAAFAIGIDHWPRARHSLHSKVGECEVSRGGVNVRKVTAAVLSVVALALLATTPMVFGEDDFPLVGTYTENQACKGDASDAGAARVKITVRDIDSVFGLCTILDKKRDGNSFAVHVECKGPGGSQMLGDINFSLRDDKTVEFADQDQTYKAVLYKCPD